MRKNLLQILDHNQHSPSCCLWYLSESELSLLKDFPEILAQATFQCEGQAALQMANLDISLCFDLGVIPIMFVKQK